MTNTKLTAENGVPAIYTDANDTYKGDLTIGGDSTVVTGEVMKGQKADKPVIAVTGGTFSSDVSNFVDSAPVASNNGTYYVGAETIQNAANTLSAGQQLKIEKGTVTINGNTVTAGTSYTVPSRYYYYQPTTDTKANDTKGSPKTFDAGIALYVGMALTSAAGVAFVGKKRED